MRLTPHTYSCAHVEDTRIKLGIWGILGNSTEQLELTWDTRPSPGTYPSVCYMIACINLLLIYRNHLVFFLFCCSLPFPAVLFSSLLKIKFASLHGSWIFCCFRPLRNILPSMDEGAHGRAIRDYLQLVSSRPPLLEWFGEKESLTLQKWNDSDTWTRKSCCALKSIGKCVLPKSWKKHSKKC